MPKSEKLIIPYWYHFWQSRFVLLIMLNISQIPKKLYLAERFVLKSGDSKYYNFRNMHISPLWTYFCKFYKIFRTQLSLRIHWRLFTILKASNKSIWSNVFWYVKVFIFWKFIQYTIHWDKTQMSRKFPSDKANDTKKCSFTILLLICDSYMSWSIRFVSLKLCVKFSIFVSVPFKISFQLCSQTSKKLKIKWYLHELELPKTWPDEKKNTLRNRSFENVSFSQ